jgi:hypothetical protein
MGNTFSTDKVTVKIKPYFYILDKDGYSQTKIKNVKIIKNINLKKTDKDYLFEINTYKIIKNSFTTSKLIFTIDYNEEINSSNLESYIKDAWNKYCNAGDPIKPNFIKEKKHKGKQIYFGIDSIEFIY